jgi:hypothetical protein
MPAAEEVGLCLRASGVRKDNVAKSRVRLRRQWDKSPRDQRYRERDQSHGWEGTMGLGLGAWGLGPGAWGLGWGLGLEA